MTIYGIKRLISSYPSLTNKIRPHPYNRDFIQSQRSRKVIFTSHNFLVVMVFLFLLWLLFVAWRQLPFITLYPRVKRRQGGKRSCLKFIFDRNQYCNLLEATECFLLCGQGSTRLKYFFVFVLCSLFVFVFSLFLKIFFSLSRRRKTKYLENSEFIVASAAVGRWGIGRCLPGCNIWHGEVILLGLVGKVFSWRISNTRWTRCTVLAFYH